MSRKIIKLSKAQIPEAWMVVKQTFDKFEGPMFPPMRTTSFYKYMDDIERKWLLAMEDIQLWGMIEDVKIIGVCAMVVDHIGMLFVEEQYHRQGIANQLVEEAKAHCHKQGYPLLTLNATPYAVAIYHHMGFVDTGELQVKDGITFTPMCFHIS